jgi:hypothetical protein
MANFIDLTNKNFGRWTVVGFNHTKKTDKYTYQMWDCLCSCGSKKVVEGSSLKKGNSVSCGCYNKESIPKGKNHYQWKEKPGYWERFTNPVETLHGTNRKNRRSPR